MRTSDPDILAVGECVEHRGLCYGLVAPLYEMAKVAAARLRGDDRAAYTGSVTSTKLKVTGIDLFSAGNFAGGEDCSALTLHDSDRQIYKKLVLRDGRIEGVVLYGDVASAGWYLDLLRRRSEVTPFKDALLFGPEMVAALEGRIDQLSARHPPIKDFVIPGHDRVGAGLDLARTITRRAERAALAVFDPGGESNVLRYLNRLSDLLWTMARWQEGGESVFSRRADPSARGRRRKGSDGEGA